MNDSTKCANGLLVLRYPMPLSSEQLGQLTDVITPVADALGVEPLVLDGGADARLEFGSASVLERLCVAVERLVQQGEPPAIPEQVEAPVLNARPTGLNSRPQYDGLNGNGYQPEDRSGQIGGLNPMPPGAR